MTAVLLVVLIAINAGSLSPPCATAAKDWVKLSLELPPRTPPGQEPSPAAYQFSRTICRIPKDPIYKICCFGELLPYAESFQDNQMKATQVATIILLTKIQALDREVGAVRSRGIRDKNIDDCTSFFGIGSSNSESTNSVLAALDRLAAAGKGRRKKEDVETVLKWTKNLETQYNGATSKCKLGDLFKYCDMVPTVREIDAATTIAIDLLNAIKL
uniref:Pectinesterase inhibitor domain-containing protein n=1 Tax=Oryza meridionalis TaxID=40149 RepID=A0A0E0EK00_9ORYZ